MFSTEILQENTEAAFASLKNPVIDQSKPGFTDASVVFYLQQASCIINNLCPDVTWLHSGRLEVFPET